MKKAYESPRLTVHGNVEQITNAIGMSSAKDMIFGPMGNPIAGPPGFDTGSFDLCTTKDDVNCE